jgi:hypothetical protein
MEGATQKSVNNFSGIPPPHPVVKYGNQTGIIARSNLPLDRKKV